MSSGNNKRRSTVSLSEKLAKVSDAGARAGSIEPAGAAPPPVPGAAMGAGSSNGSGDATKTDAALPGLEALIATGPSGAAGSDSKATQSTGDAPSAAEDDAPLPRLPNVVTGAAAVASQNSAGDQPPSDLPQLPQLNGASSGAEKPNNGVDDQALPLPEFRSAPKALPQSDTSLSSGLLPNGQLPNAKPPLGPASGAALNIGNSSKTDAQPSQVEDQLQADPQKPQRRAAKRRPSGPVRHRVAANDDAPSIGGLIYALEQKPSTKPFRYAALASIIWGVLGIGYLGVAAYNAALDGPSLLTLLTRPDGFLLLSGILVPVAIIWFLAILAWRSEELRLRSSTMAEVAIRLAEPDKLAEDTVTSLGQAVRTQVSFMNDAVGRAIGRAGELEALVHREVSALERSYEDNERKIRGLIQELSGERFELLDTADRLATTLDHVGTRVPDLLESLSGQQQKLAHIIEGAGDNLQLLETSLSGRTEHLEAVLTDYTGAIDTALENRTGQMRTMLADHSTAMDEKLVGEHARIDGVLSGYSDQLGETLQAQNARMQSVLEDYTSALAVALGSRSDELKVMLDASAKTIEGTVSERSDAMTGVLADFGERLDANIAHRADTLETQLADRTRALDDAFSERLRLFDEAINRSTTAIDSTVVERTQALTGALENHAREFKDTITLQAADLDESMATGINAVRRSTENITRHSIKAIEGIANQSDMLKSVSENLLTQINTVTNRFDAQGQSIMQAASALESANFKIDQTLQNRHSELAQMLDRMSGKADEFGQVLEGYSSTIEGTLSDAEKRARDLARELTSGAQQKQRAVMQDLQRFHEEAGSQSEKTLEHVRQRFSEVSDEVATQLGSLSSRIDETSQGVRRQTEVATDALSSEQEKLRQQAEALPETAQKSTEAVRRALQDQLRALEDLSRFTQTEAANRDVRPPLKDGGSAAPAPAARPAVGLADGAGRSASPRSLSSLSDNLAREMSERRSLKGSADDRWSVGDLLKRASDEPADAAPGQDGQSGVASAVPAASPADRVGTATSDETQTGASQPNLRAAPNLTTPNPLQLDQARPGQVQPEQAQPGQPQSDRTAPAEVQRQATTGAGVNPNSPTTGSRSPDSGAVLGQDPEGHAHGHSVEGRAPLGQPPEAASAQVGASQSLDQIDIAALANGLSEAQATQIWERLRAGERDFLSPAVYAPHAQATFAQAVRLHAQHADLQNFVTDYLAAFEAKLHDAEGRDPSGALTAQHLVSENGRAYLALAHASGRLS